MFEEEKENENNAINLPEIIEALMHNRRYELNKASEEVKRIRKEVGDNPQITEIEENIEIAKEIDAKIEALPFKKSNIFLFFLSCGLLLPSLLNPDLIYHIFETFNKDYDTILNIYNFVDWVLLYLWFYSSFPPLSEDKDAFNDVKREIDSGIESLGRKENPNGEDEVVKGRKWNEREYDINS